MEDERGRMEEEERQRMEDGVFGQHLFYGMVLYVYFLGHGTCIATGSYCIYKK